MTKEKLQILGEARKDLAENRQKIDKANLRDELEDQIKTYCTTVLGIIRTNHC